MGHLDKRLDPDKEATSEDGGLKGGVSGNVPESADYERNKHVEESGEPAPDVIRKDADQAGSGKPR